MIVFKNISLNSKLFLLVAFPVALIFLLGAFEVIQDRFHLLQSRKENTRNLVESAYSILGYYNELYESGQIPLDQAQDSAKELIRDMRYDDKEYFWINDLQSVMIMHPYQYWLEGKDLSDYRDPEGFPLFNEFVRVVREKGAGFVDYSWPGPGEKEPKPKVSFVKGFTPWGWIIGSGIYIDDLNERFARELVFLGVLLLLVVSTVAGFGWFVARDVATAVRRLQMFKAVMDSTSDAVKIMETDLVYPGPKVVYVNKAYTVMTGVTSGEAEGKPPYLFKDEASSRDLFDAICKELKQGRPYQGELVRISKSGNEYWASVGVFPIHDPAGRLINYAAIERDISREKEIEKRLDHSQRMEAVGRMTGGIAHDFNNMLTVITGNLEIIQEIGKDNGMIVKPAQIAQRAASKAADLTQHLLAFSRRQVLRPRITEIEKLVSSVVELAHRTVGEETEIKTIFNKVKCTAYIDSVQLENALMNLIINARDAMHEGGIITIETSTVFIENEYAEIHPDVETGWFNVVSVSDTGEGMSPETLERAFEPFFSTKEPGKGTGLGLAMVYGFVAQSGGFARIYSEEGIGTTVKLFLPCVASDEINPVDSQIKDAPARQRLPRGSEKILIVEDDEDVLAFTAAVLSGLGYQVLTVSGGNDAISLIEQNNDIDLLLTDVVMPGINGEELSLRAKEVQPELKVLFMSGYTENALMNKNRLKPGIQLLSKPFSRYSLASRVRSVLDGQV